jgi:hypothetical protein
VAVRAGDGASGTVGMLPTLTSGVTPTSLPTPVLSSTLARSPPTTALMVVKSNVKMGRSRRSRDRVGVFGWAQRWNVPPHVARPKIRRAL